MSVRQKTSEAQVVVVEVSDRPLPLRMQLGSLRARPLRGERPVRRAVMPVVGLSGLGVFRKRVPRGA
jgi:hypothetical protein